MTDAIAAGTQFPLGLAKRGYSGVIRRIDADATGSALSAAELESRLIELGFVEGARVEVPGTYSLRGRSPDEEITRDMVLGRTPGEALPDLVLCVADATNLRLTIRLVLELKATGRPLALVLNMFDIATRRGVTVDVAKLSAALGIPVVTSIAVRKGGTAKLLRLTDEIAAGGKAPAQENRWRPSTAAQLRAN